MPSSSKHKGLFVFCVHHKYSFGAWGFLWCLSHTTLWGWGRTLHPRMFHMLCPRPTGESKLECVSVCVITQCAWCHTDKAFPHGGNVADKAPCSLFSTIYLWEMPDVLKTHSIRRSLLGWQVPLTQPPKCGLTTLLLGQHCVSLTTSHCSLDRIPNGLHYQATEYSIGLRRISR